MSLAHVYRPMARVGRMRGTPRVENTPMTDVEEQAREQGQKDAMDPSEDH